MLIDVRVKNPRNVVLTGLHKNVDVICNSAKLFKKFFIAVKRSNCQEVNTFFGFADLLLYPI